MQDNHFRGSIPTEIGGLLDLKILILGDNLLTGSLPSEIGRLSNLQALILEDNQFTGSLPSEVAKLTNLEYLILGGNMLSGNIPKEIISNLTKLKKIDLYRNRFDAEEVEALISDLGLEFSCNETVVEVELSTDLWAEETSWDITTPDGSVVASSVGSYILNNYVHDEKVCVPSNACKFTINDSYEDGGPRVNITRLEKSYFIDGKFGAFAAIDICT